MTDFTSKKQELRRIIKDVITPLIDNDYYLIDVPFYHNTGDLLIWEGENEFLKTLQYKCLGISSMISFDNSMIKNENAIILLQGGGNFGDLWRGFQDFRLKVIKNFPNNKIIVFPQTVYYHNEDTLIEDARIMGEHKNLTICARDKFSFDLLKKHFKNNIISVPDMAFFISQDYINKFRTKEKNRCLYLKRKDKENKTENININSIYPIDITDWPAMQKRDIVQIGFRIIRQFRYNKLTNWYLNKIYRKYQIEKGIKFISSYKEIYTTRLHVGILATLLNKEFHFFNNSYGKNKGFYDTWLSDLKGIIFHS